MPGRGLICTISSFRLGVRSNSVRRTDRRESVSRVSSRRSTVSGRPVTFDRTRFLELGVTVWGSRAFGIAGEVVIGTSSGAGDGEAFRLREPDVLGTLGEDGLARPARFNV